MKNKLIEECIQKKHIKSKRREAREHTQNWW